MSLSLTDMLNSPGRVKCVVWDLDETVWVGTLMDSAAIAPRADIVELLRAFDERGILNSIASRNDRQAALSALAEHRLDKFFVAPQINWNSKSEAVSMVAKDLNIGIDSLAFVDDQQFELDEVRFAHPDVLCVAASQIVKVGAHPAFMPPVITPESRQRRQLYQSSQRRNEAEQAFAGTADAFMKTLDLTLSIVPAAPGDLLRLQELTVRTNQLNSTGRTYGFEELAELREDRDHLLLVASLRDRYGDYGKIGLALVERSSSAWRLKLLIMSCRVVSRGVGSLLLRDVMRRAFDANASLVADFVDTGRNRIMYLTYAFAGFKEISREGAVATLMATPGDLPQAPTYVAISHE